MLFFISGKKGDLKELAKDLRENFPEISENFDIVKKVGEGELWEFFGKRPYKCQIMEEYSGESWWHKISYQPFRLVTRLGLVLISGSYEKLFDRAFLIIKVNSVSPRKETIQL